MTPAVLLTSVLTSVPAARSTQP